MGDVVRLGLGCIPEQTTPQGVGACEGSIEDREQVFEFEPEAWQVG